MNISQRYRLVSAIFCLSFLFVCLTGCSGKSAPQKVALPPGITIGQISGPGAEAVSKALAGRSSGRGHASVLSGQVSLNSKQGRETESVPEKKPVGQPYQSYQPDPFTKKLWKVDKYDEATMVSDYNLERLSGLLTFDWRLSPSGQSGRVVLDVDRTRGGFLAAKGVAPAMGASRSDMIELDNYLAEELVRLLVLELGRDLGVSDLESASDAWSRKARSHVAAGNWEEARKLWLEILEMNPDYGPAHYNLGLYWEKKRNPEEAWRSYRAAFLSEASPLHRRALSRLTESLAKSGHKMRD